MGILSAARVIEPAPDRTVHAVKPKERQEGWMRERRGELIEKSASGKLNGPSAASPGGGCLHKPLSDFGELFGWHAV
jgi:hypothetical protein